MLIASYALAWAWLSTGYTVQALSGWSPPAPTFSRARDAATHAIQLSPELADGHGALGQILESCDWDWGGAKAEYTKALALDPRNVPILNLSGHLAMDEGRVDDAIHFYRAACMRRPLNSDRSFAGNCGSFAEYRVNTFRIALKIPPSKDDYHLLRRHT